MDNHTDKKYTYEEFLEIIATLRGENGCPWDRVQTHESLKRNCWLLSVSMNRRAIRRICGKNWAMCSCRW